MRIVSLLPSATEMLFAIGAGDEVVGVTHECDYPPQVKALPHLTASSLAHDGRSADIDRHVRAHLHAGSSIYALDAALLERLAPDLIVTQELCEVCAVSYEIVQRAVKRLRGDPRIVSLEPSSLEDVFTTIGALGELADRRDQATALVAALRLRTKRLAERTGAAVACNGGRRARTLVLEWTDPPMSGGHWTPGLVELAGGEPLLGNPSGRSTVLTWEAIARADPDAVVVAPCGFNLERTRAAVDEIAGNAVWRGLRARREGHVHLMDGNAYLNRPGPRLVDTAELIASMLYGDEP